MTTTTTMPMPTTTTTTPCGERTAEDRVARALDAIEQAQNLINHAAQELCDVRGMCPEWDASARVHDAIKRYWYRVRTKSCGLRRKGPLQLGDA